MTCAQVPSREPPDPEFRWAALLFSVQFFGYFTPVAQWTERRFKGLRVWLNPGHGEQLLALAAATSLTLVWATTWQHEANERIGPAIGLPPLPVIEFPGHSATTGWDEKWKWPAVAAYAAARPLAWLDDEHDHAGVEEFRRRRAGAPTLLCHVDPSEGLGPAHLAQVRDWASTLA